MKRKQKSADNWSEIGDQLLHASVESGIPFPGSLCIDCEKPAVAVCLDCGSQVYYCDEHVTSEHNIFHRPYRWNVIIHVTLVLHHSRQFFVYTMLHPYIHKQPRTLSYQNHSCSTSYVKEVVCLDQNGWFYIFLHQK